MKNIFLIFLLTLCFSPVLIFAEGQVDINYASLAELDKITGIGPALAQRIINARPFSSVDDLVKVKGIGLKTLQKIKDQGLACVNCEISNKIQNLNDQKIIAATPIIYPTGIYINEILPSPEGADETEEWFEIFNNNNFEVDLSGWQIKDSAGTIATFAIPKNTKILANGFLVFKRPDTKMMLNNDGDGLTLYAPDNKIIDAVSYEKAPLNQSYNKTAAGWVWSSTLTPGAENIISQIVAKTNTRGLSNPKKSGNSKNIGVAAALGEAANPVRNEISNGVNPWFLFLTALTITIISAIIVLLIKLKLCKKHVGT